MEDAFLQYSLKLKTFLEKNSKRFEEKLLEEACNVKDKIDEILSIGNIDLVNNAHKLIVYIINGQEKELQWFARQEGIAWSTHSIDLAFKLEWVQAIRKTLWDFIEQYNELADEQLTLDFFRMEREINNQVDAFLNTFFISYSAYKDSLIMAHRELVENLSVPIIPITSSIYVLPVIGSVDTCRTSILEEKVLTEIGRSHIQILIMDFSGIADMEPQVIDHLTKIMTGSSLMGCKTVITGLRVEVVRKMIHMGLSFGPHTKTLGTLQQALKEYSIS